MIPTTRLSGAASQFTNSASLFTRNAMAKLSRQNVWQAFAFLACAGALWIHLGDFGASEFRGGWLTGKILTMAEVGALLFLAALVFTIFLPRVGAVVALAAILLCLPFYLYIVMPGPYRRIFRGEFSVPLQRPFVWNSWAIAGIMTLIFATVFSIHRLSGRSSS
jgi:hypothetical protein